MFRKNRWTAKWAKARYCSRVCLEYPSLATAINQLRRLAERLLEVARHFQPRLWSCDDLRHPLPCDEFTSLLSESPQTEQALHDFLEVHPILVDPLATKVYSEPKCGSDYIPDFVIKRLDDEYVVVEIEKALDRLLTQKGNIHHDLAKPLRHIRDFQAWSMIMANMPRAKLPGIKRLYGLIVIGTDELLGRSSSSGKDESSIINQQADVTFLSQTWVHCYFAFALAEPKML